MPSRDPSEPAPIIGSTEVRRQVRYLLDPAPVSGDSPPPLLIALHGQGMSGESFRRVLRHLPATPHSRLFPDGPYVFERREADGIRAGHGWYIYLGDQVAFREELERSEAHILELLDRVEAEHGPVDRARSVLLGFSQGGYLAGFVGARHPERFGGVVISSARLKHKFLADELTRVELPRFLILHSPDDPATPFARAEESRDRLLAAGADVTLVPHPGGHRLPATALEALARWLEEKGLGEAEGAGRAP